MHSELRLTKNVLQEKMTSDNGQEIMDQTEASSHKQQQISPKKLAANTDIHQSTKSTRYNFTLFFGFGM